MNFEVLLVQFLVLAFTGVVWWLARRDLASRPAPPVPADPPADPQELEQLCATLEALVTDLARRLEAIEQRPQQGVGARLIAPSPPPAPMSPALPEQGKEEGGAMNHAPTLLAAIRPLAPAPPEPAANPGSASHAALYALLDEGVTDPAEIARRTGLGRGEVDLILSLRARRAL